MKLLIVEDEALVALALKQEAEQLGFTSSIAATAEKAISLATTERPDVIFMDINLSGDTDGLAAARKIVQAIRTDIYIITGYQVNRFETAELGFHAVEILQKPIPKGEIRRILERYQTS
jgi:two-component system, response regulator PdtaR